jgi:hypothetical protein
MESFVFVQMGGIVGSIFEYFVFLQALYRAIILSKKHQNLIQSNACVLNKFLAIFSPVIDQYFKLLSELN